MKKYIIPYGVKMFQTKDINIWRPDFLFFLFWCLTSIYRQASHVYGSQKYLTSIYGACLAIIWKSDIKTLLQQGGSESVKIRSSNVNIFCLEHFYTIRYNTFFHTFLYNISKVSFLCRNPFKDVKKRIEGKIKPNFVLYFQSFILKIKKFEQFVSMIFEL